MIGEVVWRFSGKKKGEEISNVKMRCCNLEGRAYVPEIVELQENFIDVDFLLAAINHYV